MNQDVTGKTLFTITNLAPQPEPRLIGTSLNQDGTVNGVFENLTKPKAPETETLRDAINRCAAELGTEMHYPSTPVPNDGAEEITVAGVKVVADPSLPEKDSPLFINLKHMKPKDGGEELAANYYEEFLKTTPILYNARTRWMRQDFLAGYRAAKPDVLVEALEFYADDKSDFLGPKEVYAAVMGEDHGKRARAALAKYRGGE